MPRAVVAFLAAVLVIVGLFRTAHADPGPAPGPVVDLYTVGPSGEFASRFGHTLLCTRDGADDRPEAGRCFDYGVGDRDDLVHEAWTSLRGEASFIPVVVSEQRAIEFFKAQGRAIERQRLPLTTDEATRMLAAMDAEVTEHRAFVYHPYRANCSTRIRDHIDAATNGRLQKGPSQIPPGGFRDYMEEGHSGRLGILFVMAVYLGETNDRHPSPWEAMLLPAVLRDGVAERFGVAPEKIAERVAYVLPTSPAVGRLALFFLAFVLFLTVRLFARRGRLQNALYVVGGVLGLLAVTLEVAALLVSWPEVTHNYALLFLLPTDLALPYLGKRLPLYLKVRLGMAGVFAGLEIATVIHQPLLPLVVLVALPLAGILSALKAQREATAPLTESTPAPIGL